MKKLLSILLSTILIISICPLGIFEFVTSAETVSGSCGDNVTWKYDTETATLTISGTGNIAEYSTVQSKFTNAPWRSYYDVMRILVINEGVTSIGGYAFYGCFLKSIWLPDSLEVLGNSVFAGCTSLSEIHYVNCNLISVGHNVLKDTSWYKNQPDGIVYLGHVALGAKNLSVNHIDIIAGTKVIASRAFYGNSKIKNVYLPDGLKTICMEAFSHVDGITDIYIPDSITSIKSDAFRLCSNLKSVTISGGSGTIIGGNAFAQCNELTSVTIGDGVISIEFQAFCSCTGLTSITIPDSVTSIGDNAFSSCSGLTSITIPNLTTSIGAFAFSNCTGLKSITIPDSVTSIGRDAFNNTAWYNNQPLGLVYAGKVAYRYKGTCPAEVTIKNGTLGIAGSAFFSCTELTSITIPDSVTSIGDNAFNRCWGLTSITIPDSVTSIGSSVFYDCYGLTNVTIPDSVTSIGSSAFYYCEGLTSIIIPDGVTSIGSSAFYWCSRLTSITIPDSVTSIGEKAFYNCSGLKSVTIGNRVTSIGRAAFNSCAGLADIYYTGTEQQKDGISIADYNNHFLNATWHYNYMPEAPAYTQESLSGTIRTGDTWSLNWRVDYKEDSFGNKSDYKLSVYSSGADKSNDSIMMYSLLGNGFLMPWLTEEYGFSKSDFTSITVTGGNANPLEIISDQFSGYTNVKTVKLSRVRIIQGRAFEGCTSLQTVDYDQFLKLVGPSAFKNDRNLQYFSTSAFVSNIEDIGDEAFSNTKLNNILLTNCQNIGESAFSNTPIGDITLPRCVRNIGENAFLGCDNLTILCYKNSCAHKYSLEYDIRYVLFDPELEDYLGMDSSVYYNDLAVIAAEMCLATYGGQSEIENYLKDLDFEEENIYSNNYGGSLAFTVATKACGKSSDNQDILVIAARGSTNIYELFNDSFSPADQSYDGHIAYGIVNDFKNAINDGLDKVRNSGKNYKVLVTGHSLGGAAANLVGVQMTKQYGKNNVFCYTFGAINSIVSSKPISTGYENIHNVYNDLDTFSPYQYGRIMKNGAGTKYGKFGHLDVFVKENRSEADKQKPPIVQEIDHINHDMDKYLSAVRSGIVQNSYLRSCRNKTNRYSIVACPVDVEVYCENKLVGKVTYNEIDESLSGVDIFVEGDVKVIIYPDDKTYDLKINAFDDGDMLYINQNSEVAENKSAINCENIQKGKEFSSHINSNLETNAIKLYTNDENSNQTIGITQDSTAYILGDINGDNALNNKDLTRLFQKLSGWSVETSEAALDINGDGKVNNKDLTRLFQYLSGWSVEIY